MAPSDKTLLVVDDERGIRTLLEMALRKEGYRILSAGSGQEALDVLRREKIDLILSDWTMPEMDGIELCKRVKADPVLQRVFFVLVTARTQTEDKIEGLDSGADDYLTKPIAVMELPAKVRAFLRIHDLQEELHRRNDQKNEFLGIAAHDLRNPLGVISLWTEAVLSGTLGPVSGEQQRAGDIILRHSQSMLFLVNNLLDVAAIESGKVVVDPVSGDPAPALREMIQANEIVSRKKGIHLGFEFPEGLPPVRYDPERTLEMLGNLLSNAIKFTPSGGSIRVWSQAEAGGGIRISVKDSGPGIPEEAQQKLFLRFSKVGTRATAGEKGTGLGLAIVKKLAEMQGGQVGVDSVPGQGATFWFTLPAAETQ